MTDHALSSPSAAVQRGLTLTHAEHEELVRELDALRRTQHAGLALDLRDARAGGSPGDADEWLTALEGAAVDRGRLAQLEQLVMTATVVDETAWASDGSARPGALVRVEDERGRAIEYELVGARRRHGEANLVSLASPVGSALLGARAGDVVSVALPGGRARVLHVIAIELGEAEPPDPVHAVA
jgi:transcription elongation factor GreA